MNKNIPNYPLKDNKDTDTALSDTKITENNKGTQIMTNNDQNINDNLGQAGNIKTQEVTPKILQKLKNKSAFFVDYNRRLGGNDAFSTCATKRKETRKNSGEYEQWPGLKPVIRNLVIEVSNEEDGNNDNKESIKLFDQNWSLLQQDKKGKWQLAAKNLSATKKEKTAFDARIKSAIESIKKSSDTFVVVADYILNFKNAIYQCGAYSDDRLYFKRCPDTFASMCQFLNINITNNTMTHEIECYYFDKKDNTRYQITNDAVVDILYSTNELGEAYKSLYNDFEVCKRAIAACKAYHPVNDYFNGLDKKYPDTESTALIDEVFNCLGLETNGNKEIEECYRHIFMSFLVSACAAVTVKPFSSRLIPVFAGKQGCGKSSIGKKLFGGIAANVCITITDFNIENPDHKKMMHSSWVVEFADCPKNISDSKKISALKSSTEATFPYRRLYSNEITHLDRQSVWFFTLNDVSIRDTESTRFPILNMKERDEKTLERDLNKLDELLGLKRIGEKETVVANSRKYDAFWNQVRCLRKRGFNWALPEKYKKILHRIAVVTERKSLLVLNILDRFGIDETTWDYEEFRKGIKNNDIKKNDYDVYNEAIIAEKLIKYDDPESKDSFRALNRSSKEIAEIMGKLFGKKSDNPIWSSTLKKSVRGWLCPRFKNNEQLESYHREKQAAENALNDKDLEQRKRSNEKIADNVYRLGGGSW